MASTLIVEDGTGIADADAYDSLANCEAFNAAYFGDHLTGSDAVRDAAIRRASAYLNSLSWKGTRTHGRDQGLAWPRTGVTDGEGVAIADNVVPKEVKEATHLLARVTFSNPTALEPNTTFASDRIKAERVGPLATEYAVGARDLDDFRTQVSGAMDRIKGLLTETNGNIVFLERA